MNDPPPLASSALPEAKPHRVWLRFRLRTLGIVVAAAAMGWSWLAPPLRRSYQQWQRAKGEKCLRQEMARARRIGAQAWPGDSGHVAAMQGIRSDVDLAILQWFPGLKRLRLSRAATDADLEKISGLRELRALTLEESQVIGPGLGHLKELSQLETLRLQDVPATDDGLAHLEGLPLKVLSLRRADITDRGLMHLGRLGQLESLDLAHTRVTGEGLAHLAGLSQLRTLDLGGTAVSDDGLKQLQPLAELRELVLNGAKISDAGLAHLKALPRLEKLFLAQTLVTDAGLEHVAAIGELQWLSLRDTRVTDAGLIHLKGMPRLEGLDLADTAITGSGLEHLRDSAGLHLLSLNRTEITDAAAPYLGQLRGFQGKAETRVEKGPGFTSYTEVERSLYITQTRLTSAGFARLRKALPYLYMATFSTGDLFHPSTRKPELSEYP